MARLMMSRLFLGCAIAVLFWLAAPTQSPADQIPTYDLLEAVLVEPTQEPFVADFDDPYFLADRDVFIGYGELGYLITDLLRQESWDEWTSFQRNLHTIMPLEALKRIVLGLVPTEVKKRKQGEEDTKTENYVRIFMQEKQPDRGKVSLTEFARSRSFDLVGWLMKDEGLFSGKEWDWENFLPRVASIGGLLVFGILLTEMFRAVFGLGARMMGRHKRTENESSL